MGGCGLAPAAPSCTRSNATIFCMSLRATFLPPRTRPSFSMSLRTSAHTGVAIRIPAEMPGKLAAVRANSLRLTYLPKVLFSVLCYCKENGLPRRSAPRNDKGEGRPCTRAHVLPSACHCACPCTRRSAPAFCMSLRTSAHTGVAIRIPAEEAKSKRHLGRIRYALRICREELLFGLCCRRRDGLPRRFAPRNDRSGRCAHTRAGVQCTTFPPGDADCHVASLLAMTCKNLLRVRAARTHYRNKSAPLHPCKPLPRRENTFPPDGKFVNLGEDFFRWVCYNDGQWEKFPF